MQKKLKTVDAETLQAMPMDKTMFGPPKSRDSYRDISVPPSLRGCALFLQDTKNRFIWEVRKKGVPCNPSYFRDKFKEALQSVEGVRVMTPTTAVTLMFPKCRPWVWIYPQFKVSSVMLPSI